MRAITTVTIDIGAIIESMHSRNNFQCIARPTIHLTQSLCSFEFNWLPIISFPTLCCISIVNYVILFYQWIRRTEKYFVRLQNGESALTNQSENISLQYTDIGTGTSVTAATVKIDIFAARVNEDDDDDDERYFIQWTLNRLIMSCSKQKNIEKKKRALSRRRFWHFNYSIADRRQHVDTQQPT